MILIHRIPWALIAIALPMFGALRVFTLRNHSEVRRTSVMIGILALACSFAAWLEVGPAKIFLSNQLLAPNRTALSTFVGLDELSAPLFPLSALAFFLTMFSTLRTKAKVFSFAWCLVSESVVLAAFAVRSSWLVVLLLALGSVTPLMELREHNQPRRLLTLYMSAFIVLLLGGRLLLGASTRGSPLNSVGLLLLSLALLLRCGAFPFQSWVRQLYQDLSLGTAMLFTVPMTGAYGAVRLVFPIAPNWLLDLVALLAITTALYSAGISLCQDSARSAFCHLLLSNSSLVLVGLVLRNPVGLTGGLVLWMSVGISQMGFGLTLRCIESRVGRLNLSKAHGLYRRMPMLAAFFLLTGLASIGFPGAVGFVGLELIAEGTVVERPLIGVLVVIVTALNGLSVINAYFRVFSGPPYQGSIDLSLRRPERAALLVLVAMAYLGGLFPQPGIDGRYQAARLLSDRSSNQNSGNTPTAANAQAHASSRLSGRR